MLFTPPVLFLHTQKEEKNRSMIIIYKFLSECVYKVKHKRTDILGNNCVTLLLSFLPPFDWWGNRGPDNRLFPFRNCCCSWHHSDGSQCGRVDENEWLETLQAIRMTFTWAGTLPTACVVLRTAEFSSSACLSQSSGPICVWAMAAYKQRNKQNRPEKKNTKKITDCKSEQTGFKFRSVWDQSPIRRWKHIRTWKQFPSSSLHWVHLSFSLMNFGTLVKKNKSKGPVWWEVLISA